MNNKTYKVLMIESEAGWGSKIDEVKEFDSRNEAVEFCNDYNNRFNNKKVTPSWYIKAELAENAIYLR